MPGATSVEEVLNGLSRPGVQGWPVMLSDFVPRPASAPVPAAPAHLVADVAEAPPQEPQQATTADSAEEDNPYGAPVLDTAAAEEEDNPYGAPVLDTAEEVNPDGAPVLDTAEEDNPYGAPVLDTADAGRNVDAAGHHAAGAPQEQRPVGEAAPAEAHDESEPSRAPAAASEGAAAPRGTPAEELAKAYMRGYLTRRAIATGRMRGEAKGGLTKAPVFFSQRVLSPHPRPVSFLTFCNALCSVSKVASRRDDAPKRRRCVTSARTPRLRQAAAAPATTLVACSAPRSLVKRVNPLVWRVTLRAACP